MIEPKPVFYGIGDKKLLAILDALRNLKFIHRSGHVSAVDDGISARATHLFKHQHLFTASAGFNRRGKPCKTGADDDDIVFLVEFDVLGILCRARATSSQRKCSGANRANL